MTVISDTACLSALGRIGRLELLRALFGRVVIPSAVYDELLALAAFNVDITGFSGQSWLVVREPALSTLLQELLNNPKIDPNGR